MRRISLYFATALITLIVGVSVTRVWNSLSIGGNSYASASGSQLELSLVRDTSASAVEQEIREISHQYDIAQTNHDAAFFERIEADNFTLTYMDGSSITKAEDIALLKTLDPNVSYESDDLHVEVYGNVAILTGRMTEKGPTGSRYSWRWLDLFLKRHGSWQIMSTAQVG